MNSILIPFGMSFWKAMLAGLVPPVESEAYLSWVRTLPCVIMGGEAEPHHLVGHSLKPVGGKTSDFLVFPLSPTLHRPNFKAGLHHMGHKAWEAKFGDQRIYVMQTLIEAAHRGILTIKK